MKLYHFINSFTQYNYQLSFKQLCVFVCVSVMEILAYMRADLLDTFIVYNERRKVTSSAKKKRKCGDKSLHQVNFCSYLVCLLGMIAQSLLVLRRI